MAAIIKKIKKGIAYYYIAQSGRVNGKSRIIWQKYIGTIDTLLKWAQNKGSTPNEPVEVDIFEVGGIAAMLQIAKRIGLVEIIDKIVPKRNQGPSVGEYILLAAINRVVDPCSKLQMPDWYQDTVLPRLWKHKKDVFSSQSFWENMNLIPENAITKIQELIAANVCKEFKLNPNKLLYDTTNFFTYIATRNDKNTIAQRGRSKQKRNDLRQIGLALLVDEEFQIPLFHKTYNGNEADKGLFPKASMEIRKMYLESLGKCQARETTLVFDKGNIAEEAMELLGLSGQHFVCGLPKNSASDIFLMPVNDMESVPGLFGTKAKSFRTTLWGKEVKAVVAYAESYFSAQMADLTERMQKTEAALNALNKEISSENKDPKCVTKRTEKSVRNSIDEILSYPYMKKIYSTEVKKIRGSLHILCELNKEEFNKITETEFGRTILVTDRLGWSEKEIILAYRGLNGIEDAFKRMKHRDFLHFQPQFHWSDQKILVHALYCVLALLLATLAHKIVVESGIDISLPRMIEQLNKIREVILFDCTTGKCTSGNKTIFSRTTTQQRKMAEALEIAQILHGKG